MWLPRIIPCLLLSGEGLVKTRRFKDPTYVGDPINAIKIFNDKGVDELIFLDIAASREGRGPNFALLEKLAAECFMPLCYGGGISGIEQARRVIGLGFEKVSVNTSALGGPELVAAISRELGASSTVGAFDVGRNWAGRYRVHDSARRKLTGLDPVDHARALVAAGAGEVLVNSVDADGMQKGFDLQLVRSISEAVDVPVIACGGAGSLADLRAVVHDAGASAAAAGSLFVFKGPHRAVLISYPSADQVRGLLQQPEEEAKAARKAGDQ